MLGCGGFFLFVFLLNDFHCEVFAFFPFNSSSETSFDFVVFHIELLLNGCVGEEFILREMESEGEIFAVFALGSLDFGQMAKSFFIIGLN